MNFADVLGIKISVCIAKASGKNDQSMDAFVLPLYYPSLDLNVKQNWFKTRKYNIRATVDMK